MNYLKPLLYIPYLLIDLVLILLGFIAVPLAIEFAVQDYSIVTRPGDTGPRPIINAPKWLWIWGNDEEGLDPKWYQELHPAWSRFKRMFAWDEIRNSTNNIRFIKWLNPPQRASDVRWSVRGNWTFVWQGICSRIIWHDDNRNTDSGPWFSVGWKYEPEAKDADWLTMHGQGFGVRWGR